MSANAGHPTVFYSWQSDAPAASNRGLIQDALEAAVRAIAKDESVEVVPRVDRDTSGVAGSPDIGATILAKIDAASVFVADVSLVLADSVTKRRSPNPNVLFELGYAWKALGGTRVILAMNDHFGAPELLPFDLKTKRTLRYTNDPDVPDRAAARRQLASSLESALRLALDGMPQAAPPMSTLDSAFDAIRNERRGRDVVVRDASKEFILAAVETGASLRPEIANEWHPESAMKVFELLSEPAPHLAEFARLARAVAEADDAKAFEGVLLALDAALDATWLSTDHIGRFPLRHFDFARVLSEWLLLVTIAPLVGQKRYSLLRAFLDHRFSPSNPEHGRNRDGGHPFTTFQQEVQSAATWRPDSTSRYKSPVGAALKRVTESVLAVDPKAPSFEEIKATDALLAFASHPEVNGCSGMWIPNTAAYVDDERFGWFRDLVRRKNADAILKALGFADAESARTEWREMNAFLGKGRRFPPYDEMKPESIASMA